MMRRNQAQSRPAPAATTAVPRAGGTTIDREEIERFDRMARSWWDPEGDFRPLHRMNPARIAFVRDAITDAAGRRLGRGKPLAGIKLLDVGCGGGLLSEPLARLGAAVTGIDAGAEGIAIAARHADEAGLEIAYRVASAEDLAAEGGQFDAVIASEVVEHVADVDGFVAALARLVRPDGVVVMSTINRTPQSFLGAIVGAEWLLRWVPRGTHDWRKFLKPHELAAVLRRHGLQIDRLAGIVPDPRSGGFRLSDHALAVNYILSARKSA